MAEFFRWHFNTGNRVFDDLKISMDVDGEKAFGITGNSSHFTLLNNNGGRINDLVGSNGGIDNMEVSEQAFKLFEAWVQQNFWGDKLSVLAGLHDLNSEFYVTETSGLFLNPTYGIGTEMAATGDNGPSIFPYSSLGVRVAVKPTEETYVQGAIYDGVPGDPNKPRGTHATFKDKDGALWVTEAGIKNDILGHIGAGLWKYTAKRDDVATTTPRQNSQGYYFLFDRNVYVQNDVSVDGFFRIGFTAGDVEQFKSNTSVGFVASGLIASRPDGQFGLAVTRAENGKKYRQANAGAEKAETQIEFTYADKIAPWLSVQPDIQYTMNPGTDPANKNAWTGGVRFVVEF